MSTATSTRRPTTGAISPASTRAGRSKRPPHVREIREIRGIRDMKIDGTAEIHAKRERVFRAMTDPEALRRCIPGCEQLDRTGDDVFAVTMRAGVGSIKGVFKGTVKLEDVRAPEHFRMVVEGKGQ